MQIWSFRFRSLLWLRALQIETHTVGVDYSFYGNETTKSLRLHQPLDRVQVPHRDTEQYVAASQLSNRSG